VWQHCQEEEEEEEARMPFNDQSTASLQVDFR
jgi:hypothetical protein